MYYSVLVNHYIILSNHSAFKTLKTYISTTTKSSAAVSLLNTVFCLITRSNVKGPSIKYVRFRGWVGGTIKSVIFYTRVGGGGSNGVCTLLKK